MHTWCRFSLGANNGWILGTIKRSAIVTSCLKAFVMYSRSWALKRSRCCRRRREIENRAVSREVGNRLRDECCCEDGGIGRSSVLSSRSFRMVNGGGVSSNSQCADSSLLACFLFLEALLSVITCEREMCNALCGSQQFPSSLILWVSSSPFTHTSTSIIPHAWINNQHIIASSLDSCFWYHSCKPLSQLCTWSQPNAISASSALHQGIIQCTTIHHTRIHWCSEECVKEG